jgi:hypothetical protein
VSPLTDKNLLDVSRFVSLDTKFILVGDEIETLPKFEFKIIEFVPICR